jgi:hypothetical protein
VRARDDGVGLAAPQVGVNVRLMVFNELGPEARGGPTETILVNPEIVGRSKKLEVDEEGCLSFPKIYADVEVRGAGGWCWCGWAFGTVSAGAHGCVRLCAGVGAHTCVHACVCVVFVRVCGHTGVCACVCVCRPSSSPSLVSFF